MRMYLSAHAYVCMCVCTHTSMTRNQNELVQTRADQRGRLVRRPSRQSPLQEHMLQFVGLDSIPIVKWLTSGSQVSCYPSLARMGRFSPTHASPPSRIFCSAHFVFLRAYVSPLSHECSFVCGGSRSACWGGRVGRYQVPQKICF